MRRTLIGSGTLLILYALGSLLLDDDVNPAGVLVFALAVLLLHDAVLMPVVLLAGTLITRVVTPGWQSTVRFIAIIDLSVLVVALPLVISFGLYPYAMGLSLI